MNMCVECMHVCVCLFVYVLMTPWLCLRSFLCAVMKWFQCYSSHGFKVDHWFLLPCSLPQFLSFR